MSQALIFDKYRKRTRESLFNRLLLILVVALSLFLIGELVFHFLVAPRLTIRNVVIQSDLPLSQEEILSIAGTGENPFYYSVDPEQIRMALQQLPMVRTAVVERVFPDSLHISLYGRIPLTMLFYTNPEGASIPIAIDDQGVVFQIGSALSEWDLPIITGIQFKRLEMGMKLPEKVLPVLLDLQKLRQEDPEVFRLISELRLIPKSSGKPEVLLYPIQHPVRLRLAGGLDSGRLRNAAVILDLLAEQDLLSGIKELDMRTGAVVYRMEEE